MQTVSTDAPLSTKTYSKPDGDDYEPDEEWKLELKKRIQEGLQSMVADAKENHAAELRNAPDTPETRLRYEANYKNTMQTINNLATEKFQFQLECERNQRRWVAGVPITPDWTQYFHEEHQNIINSIKQSSSSRLSGSVDSLDRNVAPSPPKLPPQVWKPAISPIEGALPAKTLNLGRRGSAASMRATGSGASIHPSITETIPERADDGGPDESAMEENAYERAQETTEQGKTWISTDKLREKEKRPHLRRDNPSLLDGYCCHNPSASGIPIPRRTLSLKELTTLLARRDWATEGSCHPNHDYHQQARLSLNVESFSDDGESSSEDETETKRQDLEARRQKLQEIRREVDDELQRIELEIQQMAEEEARRKRENEEKRNEVERKEEEARRGEVTRMKEEELRSKEADLKKKEEEIMQREVEAKRMAEAAKRKEQDARKKVEAAKRTKDEARRKAEELSRKEEETRQKAMQIEADTEKAKQMQLEIQNIADDLKKVEEVHKKDMELKQREDILRWREAELIRREADNFRSREEDARKREEAQQKRLGKKKAAEAEREEDIAKWKLRAEEAKRREENLRREETRLECLYRGQEENRLESQPFNNIFFDLDYPDPKLMDEQLKLLQQAEFRKREQDIWQRKHNDSVGNDNAWPSPSYHSASPSMSRTPQTIDPSIPERNASPSGWGTGPASAWHTSMKPTASSPTTSISSTSTPTGIQRTGSVSSGTRPTSRLRHTTSFSETRNA